jgi:tetratricopeptide (TPR) repeat protein
MNTEAQFGSLDENETSEIPEVSFESEVPQDSQNLLKQMLSDAYSWKDDEKYQKAAEKFLEILKTFEQQMSPQLIATVSLVVCELSLWLGEYKTCEYHAHKVLECEVDMEENAYEFLARVAMARFQFTDARKYMSHLSPKKLAFSILDCLICIRLRDVKGADVAIQRVYQQCEKENKSLPDVPELQLCEAFCMLLRGHSQDAVTTVRRLQKKGRLDPSLLLLCAEIYMTAGSYNDAYNTSKDVESKCPENDQVHAILAHVHYAQEDFVLAKSEAEKSLQRNSQNHYARTILMKLFVREGKFSDAEKIGVYILQESPEYSLGHANLGDVYFIQGRYDLAKIEYGKTESLIQSKTKGALLRQGRIHMMNGLYDLAVKIYEDMTTQVHTYYDDAMCDLLMCYEKLEEQEKRQGLIEKMNLRKSFNKRLDAILVSLQEKKTEPK